ncbi:hypothetical protein JCM8547_007632 [Rhodosporidiobolus lusitaniae]
MAPVDKKKKRASGSLAKDKDANGRPAKLKKVKEVVFDADSRKEYLTGFSKRKKAKQTAKRNKAIQRDKDELRKMRQQIRDERKERAAHNVKVAKEMYGDAGSSDDEDADDLAALDSDASSESEEEPETTFETADALTTVHVEPLSFSRSPSPEPSYAPPDDDEEGKEEKKAQAPTSSYKKRVRGTVQARPKLTRKDRKDMATGGKKLKKKMQHRMKGTKARSAR